MSGSDQAAARLIERVVSDPVFRARFRRDPEAAARDLGLELDTDELADAGLETLEVRESKSSLAGAMMAAAAEGVGLYELIHHASSGGLGVADAAAAMPHLSDQAIALLHDSRIQFDAAGIGDLRSGRIDPRIVEVLGEVAKHHRIGVSSLMSDHPVHTTGGAVSNHTYGRAVDIATVDGRPVSRDNGAARTLADELLHLDPSIRPTELGSPWALGDPAAFTDADHQDHIHVAFDDPMSARDAPPAAAVTPDDIADPQDDSGDGSVGSDSDDADPDDDEDGDEDSDEDEDDDEDDNEDDDNEDDDNEDDDNEDDDNEDDEDEDEPDENEVGPDQDDLTDDEVTGENSGDSSEQDDSDDGSDQNDSDDGDATPDLSGVDAAYPGDDAPTAGLAAWMAAEAQRRGLPPELPVMAALVESGMHNLPGGDADSMGFFQMRASIWDTGDYAGYSSRPQLQLDWFLDHAAAVRGQRVAAGLPINDPKHFGDWIADVERPAAQYRGRYQLRLDDARELLRQGPGVEIAEHVDAGAGLAAGPRAVNAVAEARRYLGTPYRWGGSSPSTGFDCSGLVQWAYAKVGIRLPRTSEEQILAAGGRRVDRDHLLPGDLVFFRDASGDVHHVGISLGGHRFIEAPQTGEEVRIASLNDPYYAEQFTGGRRFDAAVSGDGNEARVLPIIRRR